MNNYDINYPRMASSVVTQSGITQPPGLHPKQVIKIFGQTYILCKDASDPTTAFPHNRVKIQEGDCVHIKEGDIDVYFCYLHGIIMPMPNSLETAVNVYYVGFHDHQIDLRYITPADVARMHVYKVDSTNWSTEFVKNMLGATNDTSEREPISPFPPGFLNSTIPNNQKPASIVEQEQKLEGN